MLVRSWQVERWLVGSKQVLLAGVDEVGRGCLAGPVVAAAVIFSPDVPIAELQSITDSKKLTAKKREVLLEKIQEIALDISVGAASVQEIDHLNIRQASLLAMQRAVQELKWTPDWVLVDGNDSLQNRVNSLTLSVIKGDIRCLSIGAASIVAKEWRDRYMKNLSKEYPFYDWENNVGYGTSQHLDSMNIYGISPHHRQSFSPVQTIMRNREG
ncbi:ribonuclease HII [Alicyclobacillus sp. TC]|uniref:ribonuclease HII n=1 Tax=Alicyclobacillus sp. TC TaxID=2606450 RepID=UPI001933ADA9|nr:ribonuclease HII [Alicyclobacillus sp. TC]QRF23737.1 ribonuclease HII [Alicyclobacillus sp. TC]